MSKEIKRYSFDGESPDGEWVHYADFKAELNRLKLEIYKSRQQATTSHVDESEHLDRLELMISEDGDWDLSDNDKEAIRWAVNRLRGQS